MTGKRIWMTDNQPWKIFRSGSGMAIYQPPVIRDHKHYMSINPDNNDIGNDTGGFSLLVHVFNLTRTPYDQSGFWHSRHVTFQITIQYFIDGQHHLPVYLNS